MEEKYKELEYLYLQMKGIDNLAHKKYSIDFGVRDRAYTDKEYEDEDRLAREIEIQRKQFDDKRKAYARTFSSLDEFEKLAKLLYIKKLEEHDSKGCYDERKYSGMGAIIREAKEDFESMKNLSTHEEQNGDSLER